MGENRQTLHSIHNGSNKLTGRPKLCQLPINSIQGHLIMYDSMCVGIYKSLFQCPDFLYCLRSFLAINHLLRVIIHLLRVIVYFLRVIFYLLRVIVHLLRVATYFLRVITYFLRDIVPVYCITHIIPAVKSGNIGNILLLKGPINLSFFLPPFQPPIVLDIHYLIPIPF